MTILGVDNVKPWSWNIENGFRLKLDGTLHKSTVELDNCGGDSFSPSLYGNWEIGFGLEFGLWT